MKTRHADVVLVPIGDVARRLGVTHDTVRRWEREGRLPAAVRTSGNQRRFRSDDIDAFVARRAEATA